MCEGNAPSLNPSPATRGEGSIAALLRDLVAKHRSDTHVPLIGVAGAQGSGKTYVCRQLARENPRIAHFSLDDVYFTKAERAQKAQIFRDSFVKYPFKRDPVPPAKRIEGANAAYPLLLTRGPPGTHDIGLAGGLVARLRTDALTPIPVFDKSIDDRAPKSTWPEFEGPAEAILIDGWCLGALPINDSPPINAVEAEDILGMWRAEVLHALESYQTFFQAFDEIVFLQAPSFEIVREWRGQQEEETLGRAMNADERAKLDRFIMFYERITRSMFAGKHRASQVVRMSPNRSALS